MRRCLQLAKLAEGFVAPNPMVGAVLVYENKIIAEGFHQKYGEAHAEVNCIENVPEKFKHLIPKSTLYVSLEPCTHFGNTPPCTDLIIKHCIAKVVIACTDSYEKVNGSGIEKLRTAGIEVNTGILEAEAIELNKHFFTFHKKQRPYIILKWAQSSNLKIADENAASVKISNEITNRMVHKWRSEEAAIMIGTNTALYDNPLLTTRYWPGKNPLRIIIDKHLAIPAGNNIFNNEASSIIINTIKNEEKDNILFYKTGAEENLLAVIINLLYQRNINSLLVEGGTKLLQSFIDEGLWDEVRIITNKDLFIKEGITAPHFKNGLLKKTEFIFTDEIQFIINKN